MTDNQLYMSSLRWKKALVTLSRKSVSLRYAMRKKTTTSFLRVYWTSFCWHVIQKELFEERRTLHCTVNSINKQKKSSKIIMHMCHSLRPWEILHSVFLDKYVLVYKIPYNVLLLLSMMNEKVD